MKQNNIDPFTVSEAVAKPVVNFSSSGSFSTAKSPPQKANDKKMTDALINTLRKEYGSINSIDPSSETYKRSIALLDMLKAKKPQLLKQIAAANIKFVSLLAKNRMRSLRMNEDTEQYITSLMGSKGKKLQAIAKMLKVKGQGESQLSYAVFNALKMLPDSTVSTIHQKASNIKESRLKFSDWREKGRSL